MANRERLTMAFGPFKQWAREQTKFQWLIPQVTFSPAQFRLLVERTGYFCGLTPEESVAKLGRPIEDRDIRPKAAYEWLHEAGLIVGREPWLASSRPKLMP